MTVVFRSPNRVRCEEHWAVLNAAGIDAKVVTRRSGSLLLVADADVERALAELNDYRREAPTAPPRPLLEPLGGGWAGILLYATVLVAVAGLAKNSVFDADWLAAGRAQAGRIVDGEWWRAITALTLHLDVRHLMGNIFFGAVFGLLAAQALGGGAAWLAMLLGGVIGNLLNAVLQNSQHSAVGASTAVFAGLGLLMALAFHHRLRVSRGRLQWAAPVVGTLVLLAWTGMGGERTDVLAHVTGLVAGGLIGGLGGFVPRAVLDRRSVQVFAGGVALLIVVGGWLFALA